MEFAQINNDDLKIIFILHGPFSLFLQIYNLIANFITICAIIAVLLVLTVKSEDYLLSNSIFLIVSPPKQSDNATRIQEFKKE